MEGFDLSFLFGHLRGGKPIVKPIHEWVGLFLLRSKQYRNRQ